MAPAARTRLIVWLESVGQGRGRADSQAEHEVVLENAYLLPNPKMPTVRALRERGVQLRMLTNSLATTDVVPVNAH